MSYLGGYVFALMTIVFEYGLMIIHIYMFVCFLKCIVYCELHYENTWIPNIMCVYVCVLLTQEEILYLGIELDTKETLSIFLGWICMLGWLVGHDLVWVITLPKQTPLIYTYSVIACLVCKIIETILLWMQKIYCHQDFVHWLHAPSNYN